MTSKHLVLVGGGHAHVVVMRSLADRPEPGLRLTLVTRELQTPYSGMLPGHVAGFYSRAEMHIDLVRLAALCGATLVHAEAVGVDRAARRVLLRDRPPQQYDVLSMDIGITPDLSGIAGAAEHAIAVKPIGDFLDKWERLRAAALAPDGPRRIALVGGGAAGVELSLAVAARLRREASAAGLDPGAFSFVLVGEPVPNLNGAMRRAVGRALRERGIDNLPGARVAAVEPGRLILADGGAVPADAALVSTQAAPPPALRASDLSCDERGFIAIRPTLQTADDDGVFAVGDCATMVAHPREKAGVFAVRQGPPLAENLRRFARGEPLVRHLPQKRYLVLLGTGDGSAIGGRGAWLKVEGRWVWRLKDFIDRRFMRRFPSAPGAQEIDDA